MTDAQLLIAVNTVWVVFAAVLVMFMQAGFAFLEAGLTRMKNAAHIAGKNVDHLFRLLARLLGSRVRYRLRRRERACRHQRLPSRRRTRCSRWARRRSRSSRPSRPAPAYLFQVVFAGVSLAIVWGAMAERAKLWVYFAFGVFFTLVYSIVSHWIWGGGWLFGIGMQDFAGSTVVHYQGALAALAGALLIGARIGKFDGRRANAIPGHNVPYAVLGTVILWFGWFGFNAGSTLGVVSGDKVGFFAYVALNTNLAAAAGALAGTVTAWIVMRKPDMTMTLNGVIAALVAVTAACGFVAPWAAVLIGLIAGVIAVTGVLAVERLGIDDPVGAVAVHGMAGVWGTLATGLFAVPALASTLNTGSGGFFYTGSLHQVGVQLVGLAAVGAFTFTTCFGALWAMKRSGASASRSTSRRQAWTWPSTACGAIRSSTSRCRAATGRKRTRTCSGTRTRHEPVPLPLPEPEQEEAEQEVA